MELVVTRQSQKYVKVTKGWKTHHSPDLHLCPLGKSRCLQKENFSYFYCCIFYCIIQNTLLWGCFLPILPSKFLYSKVGLLFFPLLVVSYFVLFELDFPILLENWFLNEEKMNIWQKMRGHSRVGVDGILEEAELCRITHPMNATSNFHTWLTHSFRSSKIVILNSNKSIFLPTRPIHRIVAISCHLLIIKIVFEISQLKSLDQISF